MMGSVLVGSERVKDSWPELQRKTRVSTYFRHRQNLRDAKASGGNLVGSRDGDGGTKTSDGWRQPAERDASSRHALLPLNNHPLALELTISL
jgi:hypothetical protein